MRKKKSSVRLHLYQTGEQTNLAYSDKNWIHACLGLGVETDFLRRGPKNLSGVKRRFYILIGMGVTQVLTSVKTLPVAPLKWVRDNRAFSKTDCTEASLPLVLEKAGAVGGWREDYSFLSSHSDPGVTHQRRSLLTTKWKWQGCLLQW